jgi:hypothetical protein
MIVRAIQLGIEKEAEGESKPGRLEKTPGCSCPIQKGR